MKVYIALVSFLASIAFISATNPFEFKSEIGDCMKEMNLTLADIIKMVENNDPQYGCFEACVMKKLGVMQNDKIQKEEMIALIVKQLLGLGDKTKIEARVNRCADESNSNADACVVAHSFQKCIRIDDSKV